MAKSSGEKPEREIVTDLVREFVLSGKFKPGELISEKTITDAFRKTDRPLSRAQVRQALADLAKESLVRITPKVGTTVAPIHFADVRSIMVLRRAIESQIACELAGQGRRAEELTDLYAIQRQLKQLKQELEQLPKDEIDERERIQDAFRARDFDFHAAVCHSAGFDVAVPILKNFWDRTQLIQITRRHPPKKMEDVIKEHETIVKSIIEYGDRNAAERKRSVDHIHKAVANHIRNSINRGFDLTSWDLE